MDWCYARVSRATIGRVALTPRHCHRPCDPDSYDSCDCHNCVQVNFRMASSEQRAMARRALEWSTLSRYAHREDEQAMMDLERFLKEHICNINRAGTSDSFGPGSTLLHLAAKHSNIELMRFLVTRGANVNQRTEQGLSPLHIAIKERRGRNGDMCIFFLVASRAEVNMVVDGRKAEMVNSSLEKVIGWSMLHLAIDGDGSCCNLEVLQLLVANGADVKAKTPDGTTCITMAREKLSNSSKQLEFLEVVQKLDSMSQQKEYAKSALDAWWLREMVETSDDAAFQVLLERAVGEHRYNINHKDSDGRSILHHIIPKSLGQEDPVHWLVDRLELLLAQGADINGRDNDGHGIVHAALATDYKGTPLFGIELLRFLDQKSPIKGYLNWK